MVAELSLGLLGILLSSRTAPHLFPVRQCIRQTLLPRMQRVSDEHAIGRLHSAESKAKISAANKGKAPWNVGKHHSEETKRKIAEGARRAALARAAAVAKAEQEALARAKDTDPELYAKLLVEAEAREKRRLRRLERADPSLRLSTNRTQAARPRKAPRNGTVTRSRAKGAGRRNYNVSEEARKRISEGLRQRWADPEYRARRRKVTVSEETRAKLSAIMKAKWQDGTYRSRLTANGSHSEERRQKIAEAIRNKWRDPAYRNRTLHGIRASHNGSTGNRTTLSGVAAARWRSKISAAMKRRWADPSYRDNQSHWMGVSRPRAKPRKRAGRGAVARPAVNEAELEEDAEAEAKEEEEEEEEEEEPLLMWGDELLDFDAVLDDELEAPPSAPKPRGRPKAAAGHAEPDYIDMLMDGAKI